MLDLGAGTGQMTVRLGSRFEETVLVDHSEGMLEQARRNTARMPQKVTIVQADALAFLEGSEAARFDLIAAVGFLHHLEAHELRNALGHIRRLLVPRGHVVIAEPVQVASPQPWLARAWNRPAIPKLRKYLELAPAPEEELLQLDAFRGIVGDAGFSFRLERRAWELYTRFGGTIVDRIAIAVIDALIHADGLVWFALLRKP